MKKNKTQLYQKQYNIIIPPNRGFMVLSLLLFAMVSGAQEYVLKVGDTNYKDTDIKAKFSQDFFSYEKLVLDLAREEAIINLKKNNPRIYKIFIDLKEKIADKKGTTPMEQKMYSSTRKLMLDSWLDQKAIRIPIRYPDVKKVYAIFAEFDLELDIPYTFAELQTTRQDDLVTKGGKIYLSQAEYNEYVKENYYRRIIRFAFRKMPVNKVQNLLLLMITAEKLTTEDIDLKKTKMDEVDVESLVSRYINEQMFLDDRSISDAEYETPTDMLEGTNIKYSNNHGDELDRLRSLLQGKTDAVKESYGIQFFIRGIKLEIMKPNLIRRPSGDIIEEWIKKTHYDGPASEAEWRMMEDEYTAIIEQYGKKNEIKVYPFN